MSLIWRNSPWLRILIPFLSGMLFFNDHPYWFAIAIVWLACGWLWYWQKQILYSSFFYFCTWIVLGSSVSVSRTYHLPNGTYTGTLRPIQPIGKNHQWMVEFSTRHHHRLITFPGITTIAGDTLYNGYDCFANIQWLPPPSTPQDAYHQYLHQKGIDYAITNLQIQPNTHEKFQTVTDPQWMLAARPYLDSAQYALVIALLIGKTNEIDKAIKAEYRTLGISHLLAVSGMHVGLIYLLLQPIVALLFLKKWPHFQAIFIIILLWCYCTICQFSPSIVRACYMFSILQLGKITRKKTSPYNLLSFSAFSIILCSPNALQDWGFILSHLAVLGLTIFQKTTHQAVVHLRRWQKQSIQMVANSLQPQWITSPFTLLFNPVFPTYFLIANIVLIPYSTLLLYVSIFGMVVIHCYPWMPFISIWKMMINGMNYIVHWLYSLPFPQIHFRHFCWMESAFLLGLGGLIFLILQKRWWSFYITFLLMINGLLLHQNFHFFQHPLELHCFMYRSQKTVVVTNGYFQRHFPTPLPTNIVPKDSGELLLTE